MSKFIEYSGKDVSSLIIGEDGSVTPVPLVVTPRPDHLPECWFHDPTKTPAVAVHDGWPCICDRLRACEQRVLHKEYLQGHSYRGGYAAGLDAAEAAVLGVSVYRWPYSEPNDKYTECIRVDSAVAAIDALRKESPIANA